MVSKVTSSNNLDKLAKELTKGIGEAMTDIVLDIERVSSQAAPHKTGALEKSYKHTMKRSGDKLEAEVYYTADYAERMHDGTYKLGKGSLAKKGVKSKFGDKQINVGPGYLSRTVEENEDGYIEHLNETIQDIIDKYSK